MSPTNTMRTTPSYLSKCNKGFIRQKTRYLLSPLIACRVKEKETQ